MEQEYQTSDEGYVQAELDEITFIYQTLFPGRPITINLGWNRESAAKGNPEVLPESEPLTNSHVGGRFLGQVRLGPEPGETTAEPLNVNLSIPRHPLSGELEEDELSRPMQGRVTRALFKLSPMLFEQLKHMLEVRGENRRTRLHRFQRYPYAYTPLCTLPDPRRASGKAPAILIGFHFLEVGGAEKLAFDTVHWALEAGLRVFIISDRPTQQRMAHTLPDDPRVRFIRTDRYLERELHGVFLKKLIGQENIVALHNHHCGILYESLPMLKADFPDLTVLDSTHIVEYHDGGYPRVSGVWSDYTDLHHVISNDLGRFLNDTFGIGDKTKLGRLLHEGARDTAPLPIRMKAKQKSYRVTLVGRMMHQKRPVVLMKTLQKLARWGRRRRIDFRFDVVGEGPYREALETLVRRYGLSDRVTLHPAQTDVPALLRECDIMLLPSANEGLALVCYEAIEQGCIPITTDVGAQREIVPGGLMVPRPPIKTLSGTIKAIQRLVSDQVFIDRMASELAEKYHQLAADPTAKELLMPVYRDLAKGG